MQVNCINCGHRFDLKDAYDNYEGYVKCSTCRFLLFIRTKEAEVLSVMPGAFAQPVQMPAAAPVAGSPPAAPAIPMAPAPVAQAPMAPAPAPVAVQPPAAAGVPAVPVPAPAPAAPAPAASPSGWGDGTSEPATEEVIAETTDAIGSILDAARSATTQPADVDADDSTSAASEPAEEQTR